MYLKRDQNLTQLTIKKIRIKIPLLNRYFDILKNTESYFSPKWEKNTEKMKYYSLSMYFIPFIIAKSYI